MVRLVAQVDRVSMPVRHGQGMSSICQGRKLIWPGAESICQSLGQRNVTEQACVKCVNTLSTLRRDAFMELLSLSMPLRHSAASVTVSPESTHFYTDGSAEVTCTSFCSWSAALLVLAGLQRHRL